MSGFVRVSGPPLAPDEEPVARAWAIGGAWRDGLQATLGLLRSTTNHRLVMPRVDGDRWSCSCKHPGPAPCEHVQAFRIALRNIDRERLDRTGAEKRLAWAAQCTEILRRFEGGADGRSLAGGSHAYVRVTPMTWECTCPHGRGPRPCLHAHALHRTLEEEVAR